MLVNKWITCYKRVYFHANKKVCKFLNSNTNEDIKPLILIHLVVNKYNDNYCWQYFHGISTSYYRVYIIHLLTVADTHENLKIFTSFIMLYILLIYLPTSTPKHNKTRNSATINMHSKRTEQQCSGLQSKETKVAKIQMVLSQYIDMSSHVENLQWKYSSRTTRG